MTTASSELDIINNRIDFYKNLKPMKIESYSKNHYRSKAMKDSSGFDIYLHFIEKINKEYSGEFITNNSSFSKIFVDKVCKQANGFERGFSASSLALLLEVNVRNAVRSFNPHTFDCLWGIESTILIDGQKCIHNGAINIKPSEAHMGFICFVSYFILKPE